MKKWVTVRGREVRKARIEIIPMIDTIFFLLVFFMYTSLSMVKMNGMSVSLPQPGPAPAVKPPPRVVITVDKTGTLFVGTQAIPPPQLGPLLQARVDAAPDTLLIVNVDRSRNVQNLVSVMDTVDRLQLPPTARTPTRNAPAVLIATTPVDANGQAILAPASPAAGPTP